MSSAPPTRPRPREPAESAPETRLRTIPTPQGATAAADAGARRWPAPLVCALTVALFALFHLREPPHFDELYTLLAARGWLATGAPRIAAGVYERSLLFTALVGSTFALVGESLATARLPALLAAALLVAAVALWTRRVAGPAAAWIAGLLLALDPLTVELASFARFYSLHALLFFLGTIAVYGAVVERPWRAAGAALLAAAAAAFALAFHLQILTLMGMAGLGLWLALVLALPWLWAQRDRKARLAAVLGAALLLLALLLVLLALSGQAGEMIARYRLVPTHRAEFGGAPWYYHLHLIERYPSLWPVFPFLAILALATRPKPALLALCLVAVPFVLLSFAGQKTLRFFFFAMPFVTILWGIALARLLGALWQGVDTATRGALQGLAPVLDRRPWRAALLAVAIAFLVLANGAPARTLLIPLGIRLTPELAHVDWARASPGLAAAVQAAGVVVSAQELHALYYLGRADVILSVSRLEEIDDRVEFGRDHRTGMPIITTADSLARLVACHADGIVLADTLAWRNPASVTPAVADMVVRLTEPLPTPPGSRLLAFRWQRQGPAPEGACEGLPTMRGG